MLCEVDALALDNKWELSHLRVDRSDVLTEHTYEEDLHGGKEVDPDQDWRLAELEPVPEY